MKALAEILAWANAISAWILIAWTGLAITVGGVLVARDAWRIRRRRPKPEAVRAYADQLEAAHGRQAFRIAGDAMYEARQAKDFDRYRFLKEVSGELVSRRCF